VIVDAGGGTIDLSAYSQSSTSTASGVSLKEIRSPQCHFQGSVFVTRRARKFVQNLLQNSRFADEVDNIANAFDKTAKLSFRNITEPAFIKFGRASDSDPKLNIRSGQLKLPGKDVATFFDPVVLCIVQAVLKEYKSGGISSVFMVGGFAANDWLFVQLKAFLEPFGLRLCRPDSHMNKAAADGAVSFYLDHHVSSRVSRHAYGIDCNVLYNATDEEHKRRSRSVYTSLAGEERLPDAFSVILHKDVQVSETTEFRHSYTLMEENIAAISIGLRCYRGTSADPCWRDVETDMFSTLCHVEVNASEMAGALTLCKSPGTGKYYYRVDFEVILLFGLTELKAQIAWKENGQERRSPGRIVYNADL